MSYYSWNITEPPGGSEYSPITVDNRAYTIVTDTMDESESDDSVFETASNAIPIP